MNTERGFLQAIAEEPHDDALRLIFADYLDDQGKTGWAALLRRQVTANPSDADRLDQSWYMDFGRFASAPIPTLAQVEAEMGYPVPLAGACFRRGLVDQIVLAAHSLPGVAPQLVAWGPMPIIKTTGMVEHLATLSRWKPPVGLTRLNLADNRLADDDLRTLADSPLFAGLTDLCLAQGHNLGGGGTRNSIGTNGVRTLAQSTALKSLRRLDLRSIWLEDDDLRRLSRSKTLRSLTWLGLAACRIRGRPFLTWAESVPWPQLRVLDLISNPLEPEALAALAASPQLATVQRLNLAFTRVGDAFAHALSQSPHTTNLRELDLEGNRLTTAGYAAILQAPGLTGLRRLTLPSCEDPPTSPPEIAPLTDCLAGAAFAGTLEQLDLYDHPLGDVGISVLVQRQRFPRLRTLRLGTVGLEIKGARKLTAWATEHRVNVMVDHNALGAAGVAPYLQLRCHLLPAGERIWLDLERMKMGDAGMEALVAQPELASCSHLNLMRNGLTARAIELLAACPAIANLERLNLGINPIGDAAVVALAASPYLPRLKVLELGTCQITDAGVRSMADSIALRGIEEFVLFDNPLTDRAAESLVAWPGKLLRRLHLTRTRFSSQAWGLLYRRYGADLQAY